MRTYLSKNILCPHCGHHTDVEVDASLGDQEYYEECLACGEPIHLRLHLDEEHDRLQLRVDSDDEQIY